MDSDPNYPTGAIFRAYINDIPSPSFGRITALLKHEVFRKLF